MIIVYTSDDCQWCEKVKDLLKRSGYAFEERNVRTQTFREEWLELLRNEQRKTVPQVVYNGKRIGGYESTNIWLDSIRP